MSPNLVDLLNLVKLTILHGNRNSTKFDDGNRLFLDYFPTFSRLFTKETRPKTTKYCWWKRTQNNIDVDRNTSSIEYRKYSNFRQDSYFLFETSLYFHNSYVDINMLSLGAELLYESLCLSVFMSVCHTFLKPLYSTAYTFYRYTY